MTKKRFNVTRPVPFFKNKRKRAKMKKPEILKKIKKMSIFEYMLYSAIILAGIAVDQLTKFLAVKFLEPVGSVPIIKDVLHLTFYTNPGAAWGSFADRRYIFMSISTVMIIGLSLYLFSGLAENKKYGISFSLIISGGIGNMIDRIFVGEVVDFIDFTLINFPIFNGADSLVCIGAALLVLLLIIDIVNESKKGEKKRKDKGELT